jgi:hypothetical protein
MAKKRFKAGEHKIWRGVIAVPLDCAADERGHSNSTLPRDHRMRDSKAKVLQGAVRVHAPLSVPIPETQVRLGPACAGAAERPQARRAVAMVGNDAILIMECPPGNAGALPEQHTRGVALHEDWMSFERRKQG